LYRDCAIGVPSLWQSRLARKKASTRDVFFFVAASAAAGAVLAARYSCRFLGLCAVAAHGDSRVCGCEEHVVFAPLDDGGELRLPLNIYIYS
jgi:hypothetical protein